MTTVSLTTPANIGTRDLVRSWLDAALPEDLSESVVEVDCGPLRTATPSFLDELIKIVVSERGALCIRLLNASDRACGLAGQSAKNRGIEDRVEARPQAIVKAGLLQRIRR